MTASAPKHRRGPAPTRALGICSAMLLALAASPSRADVTITPGTIYGTVAFTADIVPTSMQLDAVNPPSEGTQYPSSVTVTSQCAAPPASGQTTYWCYSITVESALTHSYYVRPVFTYTNPSATVSQQIALPEYPLAPNPTISMPTNGNVEYDIAYQPFVLAGATGLSANGQPLAGQSFELIAHDDDPAAQIFPDAACGPSIGSNCAVNSTAYTNQPTYELYLKPGRLYSIQQGFGWSEAAEVSQAQGSYSFDFDLPYTAGAAGQGDTHNYNFTQQATVSGTIAINGLQLRSVTASVSGSTLTPLQPGFTSPTFSSTFADYYLFYSPNFSSPYIDRVFSDADFTKPFSLLVDATFIDYSSLQAPLQSLTLAAGENLTLNYNGVPSTIAGAMTFNPPRLLNSAPQTTLLHVGSNNYGLSQGYVTAQAPNGGTFSLPVIPDLSANPQPYFSWQVPAISFDLGPNFSSSYLIDGPLPLTPNLQVTQPGITYNASLNSCTPQQGQTSCTGFDTAFVDVFYTAPAGTQISDPYLDAVLYDTSMSALGYALYETAHGEGLNQNTPALQAEAQLLLRVDPNETAPFVITPSALVTQNGNTSRAPFSPFSVVPTPGGSIKVQPPLVLSVSSPTPNEQFGVCAIPVIGTAGGAPITSVAISIDGEAPVAATIAPSAIPGDPNRVAFNQPLDGVAGANSVTITATDQASETVSQTIQVDCTTSVIQECTVGGQTVVAGSPDPLPPLVQVANGIAQTVAGGNTVALDASGSSDPLGYQPLLYSWSQLSGPAVVLTNADASGAIVNFTAPLMSNDTTGPLSLQFQVSITNTPPAGACVTAATSVETVTVTVDEPPIAVAGPDQTVCGGAQVTLDGSGSTDPNGLPISYAWTELHNAVPALSGEAPMFIAPVLATATTLTFSLAVSDSLPLTSIDTSGNITNVFVKAVNEAPLAIAGPNQTVTEGSTVTLDGSGSYDPDKDPITYMWTQTGGPAVHLSSSTAVKPTFQAPQLAQCGGAQSVVLTFTLKVTDQPSSSVECGGPLCSTPSVVQITVEKPDHPPVANAGCGETVNAGTVVQLDGTHSFDPDGDALTYAWKQLSGPAATLSNPASPRPTFTAPPLPAGTSQPLVFQLTVTDPFGLSSSATVTITDKASNGPPNCSGAYASVTELWPPNHQMTRVAIEGVKDPGDANVQIAITSVQQDEATVGVCHGDVPIDAVINGDGSCLLRAEHGDSSGDRTYYLGFTATDGWGNHCSGTVSVGCPSSPGASCRNRGKLFDSTW